MIVFISNKLPVAAVFFDSLRFLTEAVLLLEGFSVVLNERGLAFGVAGVALVWVLVLAADELLVVVVVLLLLLLIVLADNCLTIFTGDSPIFRLLLGISPVVLDLLVTAAGREEGFIDGWVVVAAATVDALVGDDSRDVFNGVSFGIWDRVVDTRFNFDVLLLFLLVEDAAAVWIVIGSSWAPEASVTMSQAAPASASTSNLSFNSCCEEPSTVSVSIWDGICIVCDSTGGSAGSTAAAGWSCSGAGKSLLDTSVTDLTNESLGRTVNGCSAVWRASIMIAILSAISEKLNKK